MSVSGSAQEETEPRRIAGRYRLTEPLGSGAMGTVWAGYDEVLHRSVAIKELRVPPGVPEGEMVAMRERMMREARTLGGLSHPNVITLYDVVDVGGDPYVVMELLPSHNLSEVIGEQGRLGVAQAATVGLAMASALQAAHRASITHRDVKPGNVLVAHDGRIKLTDFGIARKRDDVTMTQTGLVLGSPAYIAPEVAAGQPVTTAADLWGLGATLFAAVEARPPYDVDGDPVKTVTAVVHDEVPRVAMSGPLAEVIGQLMIKDPDQRLSLANVKRRLRPLLEDPEDPLFPGSPDAFVPPPETSPVGGTSGTESRFTAIPRPPASPTPPHPRPRPPNPPGPRGQASGAMPRAQRPPRTDSPSSAHYTVNQSVTGTSAPRRWTTTNPDGTVAPLAADPGPMPAPPQPPPQTHPRGPGGPEDSRYSAQTGPVRPSWQPSGTSTSGVPSRPPMSRPAPLPPPRQAKLSGKLAVPLALAAIIAAVVGAGLGWTATRTLVGQSVTSTSVVSPTSVDSAQLQAYTDDAQHGGPNALGFSLRYPSTWEQYRVPGAPQDAVTVRFVSPDGANELRVYKIAGTRTRPAQPTDYTSGLTASALGVAAVSVPKSTATDVQYRADSAGPNGTSSRTGYSRLTKAGDDLWVVQLSVPTDHADAGAEQLFQSVVRSFTP